MAKPVLMINPRDDGEFVSYVERQLNAGDESTSDLQERLRPRYPAAVVRKRELSGEWAVVWYVYREGRWVRPVGAARG